MTRDLDEFLFDNPSITVFIAVGNTGDSGASTISSPAGAKNVIRYFIP